MASFEEIKWLRKPPVVPCERKLKEAVFTLRPLTDIVYDPRTAAAVWRGDDERNVRQSTRNGASDEIARAIVSRILGDWQRGLLPAKECLEIGTRRWSMFLSGAVRPQFFG